MITELKTINARRNGKSFAQRYGANPTLYFQSIGRILRPRYPTVDKNGIPETFADLEFLIDWRDNKCKVWDYADIGRRMMAHYVIDEAHYLKG